MLGYHQVLCIGFRYNQQGNGHLYSFYLIIVIRYSRILFLQFMNEAPLRASLINSLSEALCIKIKYSTDYSLWLHYVSKQICSPVTNTATSLHINTFLGKIMSTTLGIAFFDYVPLIVNMQEMWEFPGNFINSRSRMGL